MRTMAGGRTWTVTRRREKVNLVKKRERGDSGREKEVRGGLRFGRGREGRRPGQNEGREKESLIHRICLENIGPAEDTLIDRFINSD